MTEERKGSLGRWWQELRQKTSDTVSRQEAAFARGKIAGVAVADDAGGIIVEAGHRIDDEVIARAEAAGKLHALALAAAQAQAQDLREKADTYIGTTPEGREARSLGSVEEYAHARRYVGRIAGVDVTDVRGEVIVAAGSEITEQDVRACRDTGLLAALVYSAQQPPPETVGKPPEPESQAGPPPETPRPAPEPPARKSLPLVTPPEDRDKPADP